MMALLIIVLGLIALWMTRRKMKKTICVLLILLIVYVLIANAMRPEIKYPAGRDTVESFGDGTYQILSHRTEEGLYNCEYHTCIIPQVENFRITNRQVYVTGELIDYAYNGTDIESIYGLCAVIEIENNRLTLCIIPDSSSGVDDGLDVYIRLLDEMIKNGDIQLLNQFNDFSNEDRAVFDGLGH